LIQSDRNSNNKGEDNVKLKDQVAIVVGGANGIGKRTSKLFAQEGAKVMIADFDIKAANKVANEIKSTGGEAIAFKVDHTKEEEVNRMVKATLDKFGQIDILVNVAGVWPKVEGKNVEDERWHQSRTLWAGFANSTKEEWDQVIDINLNGARNCTRAVINHMIERRSGKIVNFSSVAVIQALSASAYAVAKAGIIAFTQGLAREMLPYGIRVNYVMPGGTATEQILDSIAEGKIDGQVLNICAQPEELARAVLFLVSDEGEHISGQGIVMSIIDGAPEIHTLWKKAVTKP
jgi:NAD(P)-dependent dehydrogenase (short-subunit alcohol dehydrogenase family)